MNITFKLWELLCPPVQLNGVTIPPVDVVRYLRLYIDRRSPGTYILDWNGKMTADGDKLTTDLDLNHKLTIYKTLLRPIWTYGAEM
uniref:Ubiquitin-like domain-containing protein n=1 Tax=Rhodnius prolixus TaxID=13249 RepID=T1I4T8_RHOPR